MSNYLYPTTSQQNGERSPSSLLAKNLDNTFFGLIENALRIFIFLSFLLLGSIVRGQSGIFESYTILNKNGSGNLYYDLQATTGNPDFNGANLGTFFPTNSLVLVERK